MSVGAGAPRASVVELELLESGVRAILQRCRCPAALVLAKGSAATIVSFDEACLELRGCSAAEVGDDREHAAVSVPAEGGACT